jgi:4-hydroxy-3-methylbut-2-enyl diphosphate reductase
VIGERAEAERGLLVFAPLAVEAAALRSVVRSAPGTRLLRTGMGPGRARRAARETLSGTAGPIAVAGFCGALTDDLEPGDVVVASDVRTPEGEAFACSSGPVAAALRGLGVSRIRVGSVVSADHIVRNGERSELAREGAIAVDMESAWLAQAAHGAGRPLAVVRVVVDGPGRELDVRRPLSAVTGGVAAYRSLRRVGPALARWSRATGPRTVLLAGPRSFCAGVERAIEIVERALDRYGPPVYVRKQIVHNVHVVRDLERRGAVFVDTLDEVPEEALVVFSAHGVSPQVRDEALDRRLKVIDATCPLVTKVHTEAKRFARGGYTIVLIGHDGHEEVEGTTGEAPENIRLVETSDDIDRLGLAQDEPVAYLTQTTLAVDEVNDVVDVLRDRFPALAGPGSDDICYATSNRQEAVKVLARESDLMIVIGSGNSSNSKRLVEVSAREGCPARLIDDETEIDPEWLAGVTTVGVTAGASAPEILVDRVVAALASLGPVDVQERHVVEESMQFTLPIELR